MDYGLIKASQRLSELDIRIGLDGYAINVYWFRVMFKEHDWFIRRHAHSTFEFHFIARGDCEVALDGGSFFADTGTFFLCAPGVFHTQKPGRSPQLVEYSLNCDIRRTGASNGAPGGELDWLRSVFVNTPCAPVADTCGAFPLIETALQEADQRRPGFELAIRNLVVMILVAAARAMGAPDASTREDGAAGGREPTDSRMVRIEQFVADNIRLDLSPRDIAEFVGLSERQVARVVRWHKGYATKKFITRTRLRKAKGLLCTTELTLKEIAEELGFSNEYYFNSVFKKHEGFPPGLFRESMRNHPGGKGASAPPSPLDAPIPRLCLPGARRTSARNRDGAAWRKPSPQAARASSSRTKKKASARPTAGAGPASVSGSVSGNDKSAYEFQTGKGAPGAPRPG